MRDPDLPERDDDPPEWCTNSVGDCLQGDPPRGYCWSGGTWIPNPLSGPSVCCFYKLLQKCCK